MTFLLTFMRHTSDTMVKLPGWSFINCPLLLAAAVAALFDIFRAPKIF
jgi:hypothetical protein